MRLLTIISLLAVILEYPVSARWTLNSSCPTDIKVTVPNGRSDFGSMASVHKALSNCPNITSLDLKVTLLGCSSWPDRWNFPFNYNGGDTYPTLKVLKLDGYDFSSAEDTRPPWQMPLHGQNNGEKFVFGLFDWLRRGYWKPWARAQIYGYPPLAPPKSNLDLWLGAMNWSAIEELSIDGCRRADEAVEKLPSLLHSLRKLHSTNVSFIEALPNTTLEHLTWIGPHRHSDLATVLERQGEELQGLEFRCDEMGCPMMRNKFNISILPKTAPNLRHLSINLPRNGSWPLDSLETIASLPHLRTLEIYSNLQSDCQRRKPDLYSRAGHEWTAKHGSTYCTGEDQFQKPLLSENSAEEMHSFLKQKNVGGRLQNVTFRVGDWTPPWDGPVYSPPWMEHRQVEIACSESGKVKGEKRCEMLLSQGYWPPESNREGGLSWLFEDELEGIISGY
ncbi:hypothetical protein C7974DRAFT_393323 [Boeremia exigua]|uniref:uncharacterized protein n=1 Tax=Boeremia exigua TaxID=749465 RepID=UPI001E8CCF41|nr:uncharacterized protein C7974DRAFT_393323 [Boeremia exigua]KAH6633708.1 hypothetical protein C7974DRAFT_393323 [Boeremia exigua]